MKPVKQTKFGPVEGNCFNACIASLLEVDIDVIPDIPPGTDWLTAKKKWDEWLLENYSVYLLDVEFDDRTIRMADHLQGYHIMSGTSPRAEYPDRTAHSVVGFEGRMVHDPHPSGDGIKPGAHITYSVIVSRGQNPTDWRKEDALNGRR